MLIVVRAAHVIAALFAEKFAFALGQTAAAHRTIQHRLLFGTPFGPFRYRRSRNKLHRETIIMKAE
jgi:hypothetical protein